MIYCIISQIRRAAISIPSNIAEAAGRKTPEEFKRFLCVASGSASELETLLIIASNLKYLDKEITEKLTGKIREIILMVSSLIKSIN